MAREVARSTYENFLTLFALRWASYSNVVFLSLSGPVFVLADYVVEKLLGDAMISQFSSDRLYRYTLWRNWGTEPYLMIIGLNPSTADEIKDDPTLRRCVGFARREGFGALCMTNLFAYRTSDPRELNCIVDIVGRDNDYWLCQMARNAGCIVAAWGTKGVLKGRDREVIALIGHGKNLYCFGKTKQGHPKHPLYLSNSVPLERWNHEPL